MNDTSDAPDLTYHQKIEIMSIASKQFHTEKDIRLDPTHDIIALYHAMIKAITGSQNCKDRVTGPSPLVVSRELAE